MPGPAEYGRRRLAAKSAASAYALMRKVSVGPRGARIRRSGPATSTKSLILLRRCARSARAVLGDIRFFRSLTSALSGAGTFPLEKTKARGVLSSALADVSVSFCVLRLMRRPCLRRAITRRARERENGAAEVGRERRERG
eukprot:scaffold318346_cov28-Tisochrysis_lutea.AAC.1